MSLRRAVAVAAVLLLPASPAPAQVDCTTPGEDWVVESFAADYAIQSDGSIEVVERIEVDFRQLRKHGIYRDVRRRFRRPQADFRERAQGLPGTGEWRQESFDLDVASVVDQHGEEYEVDTSSYGDDVRIRIGSPDFCVTGRRTYVIRYSIDDGVVRLPEYGELYWQATGTGWVVPLQRASVRVTLPPELTTVYADSQPWSTSCYVGYGESTSSEGCFHRVASPTLFEFSSTRELRPGEGLTFAATFPGGLVPGPSAFERALDLFLLGGPLAIPPLALFLMLGIWWRRGKEPPIGSIAPQWDPPEGLRPGPAGTLRDQKADMDDIVATILDLAVRGVIRIREVPPSILPGVDEGSMVGKALDKLGVRKPDWEIVRLQEEWRGMAAFERRLLQGLFDGKSTRRLSDLKNEFYKDIPEIRERIYEELVAHQLFARSPQSTRRTWAAIGCSVIVLGIGLGILGFAIGSPLILPAMVIAGLIVLGFTFAMPAMTPRGAEVRRHVEGLEEFIRRAEKEELELRNAPAKTPELFDKLLPYAVALDVSDVWARQFEGILTQPPEWYEGRVGSGWSPTMFAGDLSSFRTSAAGTLASSPSSSGGGGGGSFGGGSVGGGGGGGGGGSW